MHRQVHTLQASLIINTTGMTNRMITACEILPEAEHLDVPNMSNTI